MGLESVEYVMALEDEYGIRIPDDRAESLGNVGQVTEYVTARLRERGERPDTDAVRRRVTELLVEITGVDPREVHDEAHFVYDLAIDANDEIRAGGERRRRERPLDDVL